MKNEGSDISRPYLKYKYKAASKALAGRYKSRGWRFEGESLAPIEISFLRDIQITYRKVIIQTDHMGVSRKAGKLNKLLNLAKDLKLDLFTEGVPKDFITDFKIMASSPKNKYLNSSTNTLLIDFEIGWA